MRLIKPLMAAAVFLFASTANAGIISGGELLNQSGASYLEAELGLGDLNFTNISNLDAHASATQWHNDVAGYTNVISIYDITYNNTDYLIGGYSVIGHDGNGYSNTVLTKDNFIFNLTLGLTHNTQTAIYPTNLYEQFDNSNYFATFGGGHDLFGGSGILGSSNGGYVNALRIGNYGYSYGGESFLLDGSTKNGLGYFTVRGLESFVFEPAEVGEPAVLSLMVLALCLLGFSRHRKVQ